MNKIGPFKAFLLVCMLVSGYSAWSQVTVGSESATGTPTKEAIEPSNQRLGQGTNVEQAALLPPSNDNCASPTVLTVNAACVSGTTNTATTQGGEYLCINPGGGITPETIWYRFTATQTNMVLGAVVTNTTNCATVLAVFGPFAPGTGCLPVAGNQLMCQNMGLIDPGFHPLLSGLVVGQDYLVQIQGNNCGGGNDRFANVCMSINTVATNSTSATASVINNCGTAFTGNTKGGHFPAGTSIGNNNLDNNNGTTITGGSETGDDVTFVINNVSWFTFCNGNASSCNWSILLNGISGCLLSSPNSGVQAAVFTGTPAALSNVAISPSNVPPGGSFNSGTFAVGAGQCAYIMVDGFAGDECNYNLTLTNVTCVCTVVPIELAFFSGRNMLEQIHLEWQMAAVDGLRSFNIERSDNGQDFDMMVRDITAAIDPLHRYLVADPSPLPGWNYYRLSATDADGNVSLLNTVAVYRQQGAGLELFATASGSQLQLDLNSPVSGAAHVVITDLNGKQVFASTNNLNIGSNRVLLDASSISHGMYIVQVTLGDQKVSKKFAKL